MALFGAVATADPDPLEWFDNWARTADMIVVGTATEEVRTVRHRPPPIPLGILYSMSSYRRLMIESVWKGTARKGSSIWVREPGVFWRTEPRRSAGDTLRRMHFSDMGEDADGLQPQQRAVLFLRACPDSSVEDGWCGNALAVRKGKLWGRTPVHKLGDRVRHALADTMPLTGTGR